MGRSRDPVPISEADLTPEPTRPRGLCLICGAWIDPANDDRALGVKLTSADGDVGEHIAHYDCVARVAHESARVPGRPDGDAVAADQLAQKPRTPEGR
jgi:hypothetical protein